MVLRRMLQTEREEINDGASYIRAPVICIPYHFIVGEGKQVDETFNNHGFE